jgi:hypothetical protein
MNGDAILKRRGRAFACQTAEFILAYGKPTKDWTNVTILKKLEFDDKFTSAA